MAGYQRWLFAGIVFAMPGVQVWVDPAPAFQLPLGVAHGAAPNASTGGARATQAMAPQTAVAACQDTLSLRVARERGGKCRARDVLLTAGLNKGSREEGK